MSENRQENHPNLIIKKEWYKLKVLPKLPLVEGWARNGLDNVQIASNLGISTPTLTKYRKEYPELDDAITNGRLHAELLVENALFKRAIGYRHKETVKARVKVYEPEYDDEGSVKRLKWTGDYEVKKVKEITKEVAPDTQAIIYWLEHRAPNRWSRDIVSTDTNYEIIITRKTPNGEGYEVTDEDEGGDDED